MVALPAFAQQTIQSSAQPAASAINLLGFTVRDAAGKEPLQPPSYQDFWKAMNPASGPHLAPICH